MDIKRFAQDSPLGIGWVLGHVPLSVAVAALAKDTRTTEKSVRAQYGIGKASKEEEPQLKP